MNTINKIIYEIQEFPTLPSIYLRLSKAIERQNSTAEELSQIISYDQAASSKILKVANSSLYSLRGKITSISQAIFHIGFMEVKNLVLTMGIMEIFKSENYSNVFSAIELWKHSIAVGVITRNIGCHLKIKNLDDYFISGIIRDIGKLALLKAAKEEYLNVVEYAYNNDISISQAETEILGLNHNAAGEMIAEKWNLPNSVKIAIKFHHYPVREKADDQLSSIVYISNIAAKLYKMGETGDHIIPEIPEAVWDNLNLPDNIFTELLPKFTHNFEETLSIFSIK